MAVGDSSRDDVVIERRRTALVVLAAFAIVLAVLAVGGALDWASAAISAVAVGALTFAYLAAAGQLDGARREAPSTAGAQARVDSFERSAGVILNAFPDPVIIVRVGERIDAMNAAAKRMFGARSPDAPLTAIVREPRVLDAVSAALEHGAPGDIEFKDAAPRERHLRAVVAPSRAEDGEQRFAILVIRDESAIKQSEVARADFLANASHELRTPLASLMGFIETLRGHAKDDEAARERFLGIISDQAERMRRLIDDLLSLSRIEQTERVTPTDSVNLTAVVEDVADALAPLADDQNVALEIGQRVEDARVLGDRDELVQVIQNLIENAVKYTDPGGRVRVDVGVAPSAQDAFSAPDPIAPTAVKLTLLQPEAPVDGEFAWVRVTDSGRGIERRHLPRLSERFFRGDSDMAASIEGTGLGLAIVRHVMARHRGGLAVESAVGAGSRFTILAPINAGRAPTDRAAEGAADRSATLDRRSDRAAS